MPVAIVNSKVSVSTFEDSDRFIFEAVFLLPGVYRAGGTTTGAAIGLLLDVKQYLYNYCAAIKNGRRRYLWKKLRASGLREGW